MISLFGLSFLLFVLKLSTGTKFRSKLFDKLVEECSETVEGVKITSKNEYENKCNSHTVYIVLFSIILTVNIGIATYFVYSHWYLKKYDAHIMVDTRTETPNY